MVDMVSGDGAFWGIEPACSRDKPDQFKKECEIIRNMGFKPLQSSMSKIDAHNWAEYIENQTGVNMRMFNQDVK